ncbi:MAG: hypothetical protein FIA97_14630 [Methylococcaceae bacterium]|nr:hypothetical protein [Methylococcaceae bacterium]
MHAVLRKLTGGDLRSKGRSDEVVLLILADPSLLPILVDGLLTSLDPVLRMRCADAFEKVTARRPELALGFAEQVLELLARQQPKEVLWHLLQVAPRIAWPKDRLAGVLAAIDRAHRDPSNIVQACALQAEIEMLGQAPERRASVTRLLDVALGSGVPAVAARARKLSRLLQESENRT